MTNFGFFLRRNLIVTLLFISLIFPGGYGFIQRDIIFMIDVSATVTATGVAQSVTLCQDIAKTYPIFDDAVRIGAVAFHDSTVLLFDLNTYNNYEDVANGLSTATYVGGNRDIGVALDYVRGRFQGGYNGDRTTVADVIVMITDGITTNMLTAGDHANAAGWEIHIVGVTPSAYAYYIDYVSDYSYYATNYASMYSSVYTCLISNLPSAAGQSATEYTYQACYGIQHGDFLELQCCSGELLYVYDVYTYAKQSSTSAYGCVEIRTAADYNVTHCCNYVNDVEDCGMRYYGSGYPHYCVGLNYCKVQVAWNTTLGTCDQNIYFSRTHYMKAFYNCISDSSITDMCSSNTLTGNPLYLTSQNYPGKMPACDTTSGCTCRISSGGSTISISILDLRLYDYDNNDCKQQLHVTDGSSEYVITCTQFNAFQKKLVYTSTTNSLTIRFDNIFSYGIGNFWIEVEGRNTLSLSCGSSAAVYGCGGSLDSSSDTTTLTTKITSTATQSTTSTEETQSTDSTTATQSTASTVGTQSTDSTASTQSTANTATTQSTTSTEETQSTDITTATKSTASTVGTQSTASTASTQSTDITTATKSTASTVGTQSTASTASTQSTTNTATTQSTTSTEETQSTDITTATKSTASTVGTQSTASTASTQSTDITTATKSTASTVDTQSTASTASTQSTTNTATTQSTTSTEETQSTDITTATQSTASTVGTQSTASTASTQSTANTATTQSTTSTEETQSTDSTTVTQSIASTVGAQSTASTAVTQSTTNTATTQSTPTMADTESTTSIAVTQTTTGTATTQSTTSMADTESTTSIAVTQTTTGTATTQSTTSMADTESGTGEIKSETVLGESTASASTGLTTLQIVGIACGSLVLGFGMLRTMMQVIFMAQRKYCNKNTGKKRAIRVKPQVSERTPPKNMRTNTINVKETSSKEYPRKTNRKKRLHKVTNPTIPNKTFGKGESVQLHDITGTSTSAEVVTMAGNNVKVRYQGCDKWLNTSKLKKMNASELTNVG